MQSPKKINLGILIYNNKYNKYASSNIGDYVQTLAAINIYKKIVNETNKTNYGIREFLKIIFENKLKKFNFIFIKRDNMHDLKQYGGHKKIITIMNGWWMHPFNEKGDINFKIPENIKPIFVSFHISNEKLLQNKYINELKKFQPIGCRDMKTFQKLKNKGLKAYFSGCLTITIDFYKWKKQNDKIYCIDTKIDKKSIKITHMHKKWKNVHHKKGLLDALQLLKNYSISKAVYTSRLHCYLPCLAIGVPVQFISPSGDAKIKSWGSKDRFDGLRELRTNKTKFNKLRTTLKNDVLSKIKNKI